MNRADTLSLLPAAKLDERLNSLLRNYCEKKPLDS